MARLLSARDERLVAQLGDQADAAARAADWERQIARHDALEKASREAANQRFARRWRHVRETIVRERITERAHAHAAAPRRGRESHARHAGHRRTRTVSRTCSSGDDPDLGDEPGHPLRVAA